MPKSPRPSATLALHHLSWRILQATDTVLSGLWSGLWLGLLSRRDFHRISARRYDQSRNLTDSASNLGGLFDWEASTIDRRFHGCRRLALLGAGAGRELEPLLERGYEVAAFECHEGLRRAGNRMLEDRRRTTRIQPMDRDRCPGLPEPVDGVILGWTLPTLIQGRATRINLYRSLRAAVPAGAPMLLSFYVLPGSDRRYRIGFRVGNAVRGLIGRDKLDFGDHAGPGYVHFFTEASLSEELEAGGWLLEAFDLRSFPHAVASAR